MSSDQLRRVTVGLGVLLLLWGVVEMFTGGSDRGDSDFVLPELTAAEVDSIVFERASDTTVLVKRGEANWVANGYRASYSAITDFFDALNEASPGQLIAENPATHARLEIDDESARVMRMYGGAEVEPHILIGKRGRSFQDAYFRRLGEDQVYSVRTRLASFVDRQLDQWRDRTVAEVSPDSVASVEVDRGSESYTIARDGSQWRFAGGDSADSAGVAKLLRGFETLTAAGFSTEAQRDSVDLTRPDRRVQLRNAAGDILLNLAMDSATGSYLSRRTGDSTIFSISSFTVNDITPADSVLRGGL